MAPFYEQVCNQLGWQVDLPFLQSMKDKNAAELVKLEATIKGTCFISTYFDNVKDAVENLGESEIREAHLAKAEHLCRTGAKVLVFFP